MNIAAIKSRLLSHKIYLAVTGATLVVGFIVGVAFNTRLERLFLSASVVEFYVNALTGKGSLSGLFFAGLFADVAVMLAFLATSFLKPLFPLHHAVIFYRGYVHGLAVGVFLTKFGVSGLMLFIFAVMISDLATSASLIAFSTLSFGGFKGSHARISDRYRCFLLCLALSLAGAVAELLFFLFAVRPLNFTF